MELCAEHSGSTSEEVSGNTSEDVMRWLGKIPVGNYMSL